MFSASALASRRDFGRIWEPKTNIFVDVFFEVVLGRPFGGLFVPRWSLVGAVLELFGLRFFDVFLELRKKVAPEEVF